MTLHPGADVWIQCEVVRGPFPDERQVRVESPDGAWSGFVAAALVREDASGTAIRATIVEVGERVVSARLPGQTQRRYLTCPPTWIRDAV